MQVKTALQMGTEWKCIVQQKMNIFLKCNFFFFIVVRNRFNTIKLSAHGVETDEMAVEFLAEPVACFGLRHPNTKLFVVFKLPRV